MLEKSTRYRRAAAALRAIDAGYSLRAVAKASGFPLSTLADIKKGRRRWFNEAFKD